MRSLKQPLGSSLHSHVGKGFIKPDQTARIYSINFYLRSLMRVVAIRLNLEIVVIIKLYHPSDESSFSSVSTYLQNYWSSSPSSNHRAVKVRASQMRSNTHLCSHSVAIVSQGSPFFIPLPWQPVGQEYSDTRQSANSGPTFPLHNNGFIREHVWHLMVNVVLKNSAPRKTSYQISFVMKICYWKRPKSKVSWIMKTRKECGRTPHMNKFTWDEDFG